MSGAVRQDPRTFWKEEFKRRPGERIALRNGDVLKPNERFEDPSYCARQGKRQSRNVATVSFYMLPGLDSIASVEISPENEKVVLIEDHAGNRAAYDFEERLALDDSGVEEKTPLQMAAVMAGERERLRAEDKGEALALQYANAFDEARSQPTTPNLLRACDCFMVWAKEKALYPTFCADELAGLLGGPTLDSAPGAPIDPFANTERLRLTSAAVSGGEALVEWIFRSGASSDPTISQADARALIARVKDFAEDLAAYERLVSRDLARARADLELARASLTGLLVEGNPVPRVGLASEDSG